MILYKYSIKQRWIKQMRISTKGRYALRLMIDLALNCHGNYIPLKEVANRQNISDKYLEQIVIQLNKAGYVKSIRGAQGGYSLAKKPIEYTVGDILRLMEGSLAPVSCLVEDATPCPRMKECNTISMWRKLKQAIEEVVDSYTLEDLIQQQNEMEIHNFLESKINLELVP